MQPFSELKNYHSIVRTVKTMKVDQLYITIDRNAQQKHLY